MGILEKEVAQGVRKERVQKAILYSVAAVGVLSVGLLAPNVLQALKMFGWRPHKRQSEVIARCRTKLIRRDLIEKDKRGFLRLTSLGEIRLRELERREHKIPKPKRWDKKWRALIFDIPDKRIGLRDKLRNTLSSIGFVKLQRSVWIYPYDCEELVALLKADFRIGIDLLYLIIDKIENDKKLREHFGLAQ